MSRLHPAETADAPTVLRGRERGRAGRGALYGRGLSRWLPKPLVELVREPAQAPVAAKLREAAAADRADAADRHVQVGGDLVVARRRLREQRASASGGGPGALERAVDRGAALGRIEAAVGLDAGGDVEPRSRRRLLRRAPRAREAPCRAAWSANRRGRAARARGRCCAAAGSTCPAPSSASARLRPCERATRWRCGPKRVTSASQADGSPAWAVATSRSRSAAMWWCITLTGPCGGVRRRRGRRTADGALALDGVGVDDVVSEGSCRQPCAEALSVHLRALTVRLQPGFTSVRWFGRPATGSAGGGCGSPSRGRRPRARLRRVPDALALRRQDAHEHGRPPLLLVARRPALHSASSSRQRAAPPASASSPGRRRRPSPGPHLRLGVAAPDQAGQLAAHGVRVQLERGGDAVHARPAERLAERGRRGTIPPPQLNAIETSASNRGLREVELEAVDRGLGGGEIAREQLEPLARVIWPIDWVPGPVWP